MIIFYLLSIYLIISNNHLSLILCLNYEKILNSEIYLENDSFSSKLVNLNSQYQTLDSKSINLDKINFILQNDEDFKIYKENKFSKKTIENSFEEAARLELIKFHILNKLGFESEPKINEDLSSKISREHLLLIQNDFDIKKSNEEQNDKRDEYFSVNDEPNENDKKIYLFPLKNNLYEHFIFNFTLKSEIKYKKASLMLETNSLYSKECLIHINRLNNYPFFRLNENDYTNLGIVENESSIKKKEFGKIWLKYDITNILNLNYVGLIDLISQSIVLNLIKKQEDFIVFENENCNFNSAMVTLEYENIDNRNKRSLECVSGKDINNCCKESFYVNFSSIGWSNWIIEPSGYIANYCKGKCDLTNSRYHHTTVLNKFPLIPQCCSPRKMRSLSLIYLDEKNYIYKKVLPNMVVDTCDCA